MMKAHFHVPYSPEQPTIEHVESPIIYQREPLIWRYKLLTRDLDKHDTPPSEAELNELGAEGWEIAGIVAHGSRVYVYLKRVVS
ncbi:MAG: hypothetical protein KC547_02475 [Anaerolineae bacterium]|nr:hypothetical protein [Anaerolineae bacterium]